MNLVVFLEGLPIVAIPYNSKKPDYEIKAIVKKTFNSFQWN
jgi:hypothetical protein